MTKMATAVLIFLMVICAAPCYGGDKDTFSPWDFNAINHGAKEKPQAIVTSPGGALLIGTVRLYQHFLSPIIGGHCPSYPTCSAYSIEAINKHGFFIGYAMTIDRLIHEDSETKYAPLIKVGDSLRYYDPVSHNDFWWFNN